MGDKNSQRKIAAQKRSFTITSALSAVLLIGIAVFATLIAYRSAWMYDMTSGKVFTLSEQTRQVVAALEEPVEIIAIAPAGGENPMLASLLTQYANAGQQIKVSYIDAERDPLALSNMNLDSSAVANGMVFIRSGERTKALLESDMFQATAGGNAFLGENQITGALRYVSAEEMPVAYFLDGHNELSIHEQLSQASQALELDAINVQSLNLLKSGGVPADADLLVVASPREDLSVDELQMLEDYLLKGGKALFLVDVMSTEGGELANFNSLLNNFNVDISNNIVVEEDPSAHVANNNLHIIPSYIRHFITEKLAEAQKSIVLPVAMGLHTVEEDPEGVILELLLASSPRSWMRTNIGDPTAYKTDADMGGPIPLALAATKIGSGYGEGDSQIVVIGNSAFASDENLDVYANRDFFLNSVNWLVGGRGDNTISPRIIGADKFIVRGNDFRRLLIISLVLIPMIPFAAAFLIWYRRRNK